MQNLQNLHMYSNTGDKNQFTLQKAKFLNQTEENSQKCVIGQIWFHLYPSVESSSGYLWQFFLSLEVFFSNNSILFISSPSLLSIQYMDYLKYGTNTTYNTYNLHSLQFNAYLHNLQYKLLLFLLWS